MIIKKNGLLTIFKTRLGHYLVRVLGGDCFGGYTSEKEAVRKFNQLIEG